MLTVHLSGGRMMLDRAMAVRGHMLLLGVTVLTSTTDEMLREIGVSLPVDDQVLRLTSLGAAASMLGFVCSPHEIELVRAHVPGEATIVTPGVRPAWAGADDQARFMTPREAIARGADYLVIGRPITAHPRPAEAVARILDELNQAPAVA